MEESDDSGSGESEIDDEDEIWSIFYNKIILFQKISIYKNYNI